MNEQLEDVITKLAKTDKMVAKYHDTQVQLQFSKEMVKKSETAESLHEQNIKRSSSLASFRDDSNQLIKVLEEEKNKCSEES